MVPGEGSKTADIFFVARNPGSTEDRTGRPLTGKAGSMYDRLLKIAGIDRSKIYQTNLVKCFTPNNRAPFPDEVEKCSSWLLAELAEVKPKVIVAMGAEAINFFGKYGPVSRLRGIPFEWNRIVVIPTFHPSFVERNKFLSKKEGRNYNPIVVVALDFEYAKEIACGKQIWGNLQTGETYTKPWISQHPTYEVNATRTVSSEELISFAGSSKLVGADIETTSLDPRTGRILGFALAKGDELGSGAISSCYEPSNTRAVFQSNLPLVFQRAQFDLKYLKFHNAEVRNLAWCTQIAQHLLYSDQPSSLAMINSLHSKLPPWKSKTEGKMDDTEHMDPVLLHERCCADAYSTVLSAYSQVEELRKLDMLSFMQNHMLPIVPAVVDMELRGVQVSKSTLSKFYAHTGPKRDEISKQWLREGYDIASPKQVAARLDKAGCPLTKTTKTGWATDEETLKYYWTRSKSNDGYRKLIGDVLRYRGLDKVASTFVEGVYKRCDDNLVCYPNYDICGTGTGRLSATDPDFQNFPYELREMFVPRSGHVFIGADYKGIELKVAGILVAQATGDWRFYDEVIRLEKAGSDFHSQWQKRCFPDTVYTDDVSYKADRQTTKTVVFGGGLYGRTPRSIAIQFGVSTATAKGWLDRLFEDFPALATYQSQLRYRAKSERIVRNPFGRRRVLLGQDPERQGLNTPVQSTAHDIVLRGMRGCYDNGYISSIEVHDQLVFEVPEDEADTSLGRIREILESSIPELEHKNFTVDISKGRNWKEVS